MTLGSRQSMNSFFLIFLSWSESQKVKSLRKHLGPSIPSIIWLRSRRAIRCSFGDQISSPDPTCRPFLRFLSCILKKTSTPINSRLLILSIKLLWSEVVKNLSAFSFNWFRTFETKFLEHPDMTSSLECRLASNSQQIHHISIYNCPVVTSDRYFSGIGCPQKS